jgi:hypothetical protein
MKGGPTMLGFEKQPGVSLSTLIVTGFRTLPLIELGFFATFAALLFGNLGRIAVWWDEGWTTLVARSLVERGHYGRLLEGAPAPPGLESSAAMVGLVAASFKLLGVGVWEARLPIALLALAAVALLFVLARLSYGRGVARAALFVVLLLPVIPSLHILPLSGQVMAELPMLCFLLAGYTCLYGALTGRTWLLAAAALVWGLAFSLKAQYLPFWAVSLAAPALLLVRRQPRVALVLMLGLAGGMAARRLLLQPLEGWLLTGRTLPSTPIVGLFEALALSPGQLDNRVGTLVASLTYMLPAVLGCGYAAWCAWGKWRRGASVGPREVTRLCLLALVGAWWGWYLIFSIGWTRYILPAFFLSSVFQAALLDRLTRGFDVRGTIRLAARAVRRPDAASVGALVLVLAVTAYSAGTVMFMTLYYRAQSNAPFYSVATYLNQQTRPDALVETYDAELFLLLDRPYHYPPDQLNAELIRRDGLRQDIPIRYDPLAADPDYLVIGEFGRRSRLYGGALEGGHFRPVLHAGGYEVYERVRP